MGTLISFPGRPPSAWKLFTEGEGEAVLGRKAVLHVGDLATVCVVAGVPSVGDVIHARTPAVVHEVRIARDGIIRVYASPASEGAGGGPDELELSDEEAPRAAVMGSAGLERRRTRRSRVADPGCSPPETA